MTPLESSLLRFQGQAVWSAAVSHSGRSAKLIVKAISFARRMNPPVIVAAVLLWPSWHTLVAAELDFVNFMKFDGITYVASRLPATVGRAITQADLGPEFAKTSFKASGNVTNLSYRIKDGDAAFLDAGTPVYAVKGYAPSFRLAARQKGLLELFEVDENPKATNGSGFMDIGGKVVSIGVIRDSGNATDEIGVITEAASVEKMVGLALNASISPTFRSPSGVRYFIAFHLKDGTAVRRGFWPDTGQLSRTIMMPPEFTAAVREVARRNDAETPSPLPARSPRLPPKKPWWKIW